MRGHLLATFAALRIRNYRLFFTGQAISVMGTWMQKIAQAWLVLGLTGSGTLLGVTVALQHLPMLLVSPWGGLLADRLDKRRMLLWTQSTAAVPALLLGILTATDRITLWMVLVLALALGAIEALDKPARQSFVIEMVGHRDLTNAITLHNIMINTGKVGGPAIAGVLITTVGLPPTFLLNAVSFVAVVASLAMMRRDQLHTAGPAQRGRGQLREGLRYVRGEPGLLAPLLLLTVTGLLAYEWVVTLPLLAHDTFGGDAQAAGFMFTAMGAGAVIGGLAVAGTLQATTNRLILGGGAFAVLLTAVAASPGLMVAYVLLFFVGAASVAFRAVASSLLQLRADAQLRGRVMALLVVATAGTTPIGGPLLGWVGETFGARVAVGLGGVATAVAAGVTMVYLRRAARPETAPEPLQPSATDGGPRILTEHKRLDRDRHGVGREPDAPQIDVVELPQPETVDHQQVGRHTQLVPQDRP